MNPKKSFVILTNDCGFGHRNAANALVRAFSEQYAGEAETIVLNPIDECKSNLILQATESSYDRNVTSFPGIYRFTYDLSDSRRASLLVENTFTVMLYRVIQEIIHDYHPDGMIITNEMFNAPSGVAIKKNFRKIPLYTTVTDFAEVHSLWFNSSPDRFFVASERVRNKGIDCGVPANKISVSGIPVDPLYARKTPGKSSVRKNMGLDPNLPAFIFVGSRRVSGIYQYLQFLDTLNCGFQVIVIAGGDEELYSEINARSWNFPINCQQFVSNMADWMASADVLVTKAGGLILSEGLATGLPILMIDHLPGQEEGNVRFILDNQAGIYIKDEQEFSRVVVPWLAGYEKQINCLAENSRRLGHPDAALTITKEIWSSVENFSQIPAYVRAV